VIFVDSRETEIPAILTRMNVAFTVTMLESQDDYGKVSLGDVMFEGSGEWNPQATIGCERKKLSDLISSMKDRRLSGHQLRGMWKAYDYVYLFAEGMWRPGAGGEIEEPRRNWKTGKTDWMPLYDRAGKHAVSYAQVDAYLNSLALRSRGPNGEPVRVKRTSSPQETAACYVALYNGFQKPWHQHHAHDQVHCTAITPKKGHGSGWGREHGHAASTGGREAVQQRSGPDDPTTLWMMAAQLPGISEKARKVAAHFGTVTAMAAASEKDWAAIDGIGKITAAACYRAIHEKGA
jgi:ERCC4-type nuclease